jgi:hypothetical protein
MVTATLPPLTVQNAVQAMIAAREKVRVHQRAYEGLRQRMDLRATSRARSEWGLATLEYIEASVAVAEAEDRQSPVWAASRSRGRMFSTADPGHARCEQAWLNYQRARKTASVSIIATKRGQWREAFVDWLQELIARRTDEDQQHVQELRDRLEDGERLHANDAFRAPSRAQELVHASRERTRQESIRRNTMGGPQS